MTEIIAKNCFVSVMTVNIRRDSKDGNDGIHVPSQERTQKSERNVIMDDFLFCVVET